MPTKFIQKILSQIKLISWLEKVMRTERVGDQSTQRFSPNKWAFFWICWKAFKRMFFLPIIESWRLPPDKRRKRISYWTPTDLIANIKTLSKRKHVSRFYQIACIPLNSFQSTKSFWNQLNPFKLTKSFWCCWIVLNQLNPFWYYKSFWIQWNCLTTIK